MPIYEYLCRKCGQQIEVIQKMSDAPLVKCANCKGKLEKMLSQTSFQLKGAGWYVTDYGKTGGKPSPQKGEKKDTKDTKDTPATSTKTNAA